MSDFARLRSRSPRTGNSVASTMEPFPKLNIFCWRLLRKNVRAWQLRVIAKDLRFDLGQSVRQSWSFAKKFDVLVVVALVDFLLARRMMEGEVDEEDNVISALTFLLLSKIDTVRNNGCDDDYREVFDASLLHTILKREQTGAAFRWNASFLHTFIIVFNRYFTKRTAEWVECNRAIGELMLKNLEQSGHTSCFICSDSLKDVWGQHLDKCLQDSDLCPSAVMISTCGHASCVRCFSILTASPAHRLHHHGWTGACRVCKQPFIWPEHVAQMLLGFSARWILQAGFFKKNDNPVHDVPARDLSKLISDYCIDLERSLFPGSGSSGRDRYDVWEVIQLRHRDASDLVPMTPHTRTRVEDLLKRDNDDSSDDEFNAVAFNDAMTVYNDFGIAGSEIPVIEDEIDLSAIGEDENELSDFSEEEEEESELSDVSGDENLELSELSDEEGELSDASEDENEEESEVSDIAEDENEEESEVSDIAEEESGLSDASEDESELSDIAADENGEESELSDIAADENGEESELSDAAEDEGELADAAANESEISDEADENGDKDEVIEISEDEHCDQDDDDDEEELIQALYRFAVIA